MKISMWMGGVALVVAALASGCGGAPGDGVSTPGTIGAPNDPMGHPENGTTRGDGTGVPAGDHDPNSSGTDTPKSEKPSNTGPGPR